jgi:hypothetical protein
MPKLHVHVHVQVHTISMSMLRAISMLHVHIHTSCPCPCCISIPVLYVYVNSAYSTPCCKFMSILYVLCPCHATAHVHAACPIVHVHASCPRPRMHANAVCLHTCCVSMPTQDTDMNRDSGTDEWKRIFWRELKQIEANISFLGSLCYEANILKRIESKILYEYSRIKANIHRIRLRFASLHSK